MHISTIKEGNELTVTVTAEGETEKIEFKTTACFPIEDTLVVEEIVTPENEPVSLLSDKVYISVASINEQRMPIVWKNVMVKHITINGKDYHRIAQSEDGKVTNRRDAYRVYLGRMAMLQKGMNRSAIEVIVKDISTSGFSFVTSEELEVNDAEPVHLVCDIEDYHMTVYGHIIRRQEVPDSKRLIYGCKNLKFDKSLDKFIIEYQRTKRHQSKGNLPPDSLAESTPNAPTADSE